MENITTNSDQTKRGTITNLDSLTTGPLAAGAITSNSITNSGNTSTKSLAVDKSTTLNGPIYAKSTASIDGDISTDGNIIASSGTIKSQKLLVKKDNKNVLATDDNGNVTIYGNLNASTNGTTAYFSYNTVIGGKAINSSTTEGYVQATNIIAGKRLCVGTGNQVVIDDANCKFGSNKYTGYFGELEIAGDSLFNSIQVSNEANIKTLRVSGSSNFKDVAISGTVNVGILKSTTILGEELTTKYSLKTKNFTFTGSGTIGESVTILGANSNGYGLSVTGGTIIANKGIRAYNGLNEFGCLKITGQDKQRCKIAGTEYGLWVADGTPSLFKGDVYLNDSTMIFDNSSMFATDITILDVNSLEKNKRYSNISTLSEGLQLVANTTDNIWSSFKNENMIEVEKHYTETSFDEIEPIVELDMEDEFNTDWSADNDEIEKTVRGIDAKILNKLKATKRCGTDLEYVDITPETPPEGEELDLSPLESNFEFADGKYFRIDSGGHAFLKEVIAEDATFSTIRAHDFVATKFITTDIRCNKIQTNESLGSLKAFYARGISRFTGKVYNYADNYFKHAAKLTLQDKAKLVVEEGATIEVGSNATFKTDSFSTVNLDGNITLNIDKLILKDREGHSIKLNLKTARGDSDEGEAGELILSYQETK